MASLSETQINTLSVITSNGGANYWAGYTYILSIVEQQPDTADLQYWLGKAIEINSDSYDSEANTFIRAATRAGLIFDGRTSFDLQENSDKIGRSVISDILQSGTIPPVTALLGVDVNAAITDGGQTIGGWGGAFYYWNLVLDDGQTVGQHIRNDPIEYDKFIAANAKATADTIGKFGITFEQLISLSNAQIPDYVKDAIIGRMAAVLTGDAPSYAGDPENIDGYHPIHGNDDAVIGWKYNSTDQIGIPVTDSDLIAELNLRYQYRARLADDPAFAVPNPDKGLHVAGGLQAMKSDADALVTVSVGAANSFIGSDIGQTDLAKLASWYANRLALTELSGTVVGGATIGVLDLKMSSLDLLQVDFAKDLTSAINYEGTNSANQSLALSDEQKLVPHLLALDAVYHALAPAGDLAADMTATLDAAVQMHWEGSGLPSHIAAKQLEYYAFEAANAEGVTLDAKASVSSALIGGSGDDALNGDTANDILIGRDGEDTIEGSDGNDIIFGGDGNDNITGGIGDDYLDGGDGDDTIDASGDEASVNSESDTILAGAGDDVVYINGSGVVSLGAGDDEIHISSSDGGVLGLARSSSEEAPAHAVIWGGDGADSFYFDKAAHVLAVNVDSVTEELLKNLSVDAIFEYFNRNAGIESPYQYILINVDETDKLFLEGSQITSSSSIREEQFHHTENFNYKLLEQFYEDGYFPGNDKDYFPYPFEDTYPENHDFFHWEQRGDATPYNGELPELFPYGVYPDAWKLFAPTAVRDLVEDYYHRYFEMSGSGIPIYVGAGKYGANIAISSETGGYFSLDGFVDGWAGITITGNDSEYYTKMTLTSQAIDIKIPGTQQDSLSYHQYEPEDDSLFNPNLPTFDPSLPRYGHHYLVPREYRTVGEPVVTEKTTESDEMLKPDGYDSAYTPTVDLSQFVLTRENGTSDDDTLVGGNRKQSFNGGDGSDTVDYSASTSGIFVDLSTGTGFDGDADGDEFVSIENIIGTSFADTLYGNDAANVLSGKDGNDGLSSGAGDDMLFGGLGDDWFDGGTGNDTIYGGAGSLDEVDYNGSLQEYSFTRNADNSVTIVSERWGADTLFDVEQIWLYSEDWSSYEVYNLVDLAPELPVANTILGTSGDDHLVGTTGNDVIDSLGGNDYVNGGEGSDTYLYSVNDGDEYIDDEAGSTTDIDVLRFADLNYADVAFSHDSASSNLVLTVNSTNHVITFDEQYYSSSEGWGLEKVGFADGITVDLKHSDEVWTYHGSSGDDHIVGAIWGKQDVFQGGHGNDYLSGEAGSDTYVYAKGDGSDLIDDNAGFTVEQGNTDVLQLADLNQSELTFSRNGDDLQISVNETGETITVDRQFQSTEQDWGVEKIEFADGSSWDLQDIWDETAPGSSENNVVVMNSAASTAASQADTSAELASADIITFPTASIAVDSSENDGQASYDLITEQQSGDVPIHIADIISLEDFAAHLQSDDHSSDLWFEPEPIGALI
ncbi:hypothetical protein G6L85_21875 [Agrobacterium rhizogenes]|uniref:calcium-binding protein n=1 Tax=Rhizobium rhizogenes TaxID=359 RepID=UPI00157277FA|nr:calcium-binding protein [Rhizobium rhizogenes]NTI64168.1 hypothetical protein [Rhizobium rhizogenes]